MRKLTKRTLSLLFALCFVMGALAGCGSNTTEPTETTSSETTTESSTTETAEAATETPATYKIAMITDAPIADGGWNSSCYQAMKDAAAEYNFETAYSENVAQSDFVTMFREYANQGFNVIFAPGNQYSDAVIEVAPDYPDTSFVLLNGEISDTNITSILPDAQEIGYLAGALAGLQTQTKSIGFIGGMELTSTIMKMESYEKAAKQLNPDITVSTAMADSFSDSAKGKEIALSMVSTNDVDVIFGDASAVDGGAREGLAESENRWGIGQPQDVVDQNPDVVLSSVKTDNAALLKMTLEEYVNGVFGSKIIKGNLANGCLSVGAFGNAVSEETQTKYLEIVEQIKNGTFITE